jgi:polysaccharide pyruvyl transferase WcaK-like protein
VSVRPDVAGISVLDLEPYFGDRTRPGFWRALADAVLARGGVSELRLFAFKDNEVESDVPAARALAAELEQAGVKATVYGYEDGLEPVRKAIAECGLFVATRYHSAVFAAQTGVNTVIVPYNRKLAHFAAEFGAEDAVLDIERWYVHGEIGPLRPQVVDVGARPNTQRKLEATRGAVAGFLGLV